MRQEFPKSVKRDALKRSAMRCEADGRLYGLPEGKTCSASLAYGLNFDHVLADSNGGQPTLENCLCVCRKCHRFKTSNFDTPRAAKTVRQRDKANGIRGPKHKWPQRKFSQERFANTKFVERY